MNSILLVDDEPDILEILSYNLSKEGYAITLANNGLEALVELKRNVPDLVILDYMMPQLDGIETAKQIRALSLKFQPHIVFLTSRAEEIAEIRAFEAGADDFITKPIKPAVLVSRLSAFFRRKAETSTKILDFHSLQIHLASKEVFLNKERMTMPKKEYELLEILAKNPSKVFERDQLMKIVWGDEIIVGDRTLDVHIRKIREKIGGNFIKTYKGIGYMFEDIQQ
jgi:two-component system, OmpR family, alkaline phosphatase synthesis response regulator PhoP